MCSLTVPVPQHTAATVLKSEIRCEVVCNAYRKTLLSNIDLRKAVEATSG
jgi:hypothetical protein